VRVAVFSMTGKRFQKHTSPRAIWKRCFANLYRGEKIFAQGVESGLSAIEPAGPVSVPLIIPSHETPCIVQKCDCGAMPRRKTGDAIAVECSVHHPIISGGLRRFQ